MAEPEAWQLSAACRGNYADFFPPGYSETREVKLDREARAKAICYMCPVIEQCLDYALRRPNEQGIWGGTNEEERKRMRSR